jgi:cytochrome b involved in lipid metabolism
LATTSSALALALYIDHRRLATIQLDEASSGSSSRRLMRRTDLIPMAEVETHNKEGDLWVVMNGDVWDLTEVRRPCEW